MQHLAPVEANGLVVGQADEIDIGLVGEGPCAVELGDPDRHRRAVGDQPEALLALAQGLAHQHLVGDVDMGADKAESAAVTIALDLGDDSDPAGLAVAGTDDAVFGGVVLARAGQRIDEVLHRSVAVVGMNAIDPVLVRLVGGFRRQAVKHQIFRRAAVLEAFAEVDFETADLADALDARKLGFAFLEGAIGIVALACDIFQVLAQPFGGEALGQRIVQGVGRCDARAHVADRYSHRRSVMAIAQREYGKKGVAGCSMVGMSERQVWLFVPNIGTMSPPRAYPRGATTVIPKSSLSEEAKS